MKLTCPVGVVMAFYSSIINNLANKLHNVTEEVGQLQATVKSLSQFTTKEVNLDPSMYEDYINNAIHDKTKSLLDVCVSQTKAEIRSIIKQEISAMETQIAAKVENQFSKMIKERIDVALHASKSQIMTEVQLMIEDLRETKEEPAIESIPNKVLEVTTPPPDLPSIDLDTLTKDLKTAELPAVQDDDFAFNTRKKTLRKKV